MQLTTILNRVEHNKSFVFGAQRLVDDELGRPTLEATLRPPTWAKKFLDEWCRRAMRSKIKPLQKVARTLRRHEELLLNWFRAEGTISSGTVEGFNNKAKLAMRRSYGFRAAVIEFALFHNLGALPEPDFTHRFCSGGQQVLPGSLWVLYKCGGREAAMQDVDLYRAILGIEVPWRVE